MENKLMHTELINRLRASLTDLELSINNAYALLQLKENVPVYVLDRMKTDYAAIVLKQKGFATELEIAMTNENYAEVGRLVKIINELSAMIRDDARDLLLRVTTAPQQ